MPRNANDILRNVLDIAKEIKSYERYREEFFKSLTALDNQYAARKMAYIEYERRRTGLLDGRTKKDWQRYYASTLYSLLKKVEVLISEAFDVVYADHTEERVFPKAEEAPTHVKARPAKIKEIFNIDTEVARLAQILESTHAGPAEQASSVRTQEPKIPALESVTGTIERAEKNRQKKIFEINKQVATERAIKANVVPDAIQAKSAQIPKKKFALPHVRFPKLGILLLPFKAVHKAVVTFTDLLNKGEARFKKKGDKPVSAGPAPKNAGPLISFTDVVDEREEHAKQKTEAQRRPLKDVLSGILAPLKNRKQEGGVFVEEIVAMERKAKNVDHREAPAEAAGIVFGWFNPKRFLDEFTSQFRKKQEPILGLETAIPLHMKKLRAMRKQIYEQEKLSGFDSTLLAQEAKRVKRILEVEKAEVYKGSSLGLIANVTVRRISLFLVNTFPQFFGYLYNALRAANVKVLSNTYVNIMILITIMLTGALFIILLVAFFFIGHPLYQVVLRSIIFSLVAGALCATIFYLYPFLKIKDRRRKTTTNLPFAVNHMAAVSTSGVPPARMFELIAESGEYDEVGIELKKIVDFIKIFGYDLLTAIKVVATTTPSLPFKKFLEGMVNTIETGGDLDSYLRQQADEAALTYKLERQRYNETISTYSDIYTGVLIAAPLFFVAALALVNLLGGTLGGLSVGFVMAMGAYVGIPLINILFLLFLQMTQPDV